MDGYVRKYSLRFNIDDVLEGSKKKVGTHKEKKKVSGSRKRWRVTLFSPFSRLPLCGKKHVSEPQQKRKHASHRSNRRLHRQEIIAGAASRRSTGNMTPGKKNRRNDLRQFAGTPTRELNPPNPRASHCRDLPIRIKPPQKDLLFPINANGIENRHLHRWNQEPVLHRRKRCSLEPKARSFVEKTVNSGTESQPHHAEGAIMCWNRSPSTSRLRQNKIRTRLELDSHLPVKDNDRENGEGERTSAFSGGKTYSTIYCNLF
ncbi:hypothetical protein YC2023_079231 [Brassica napus]